ncbi:unnamed protein product [Pelagomonas calceolata]|uniref:Uncharacterized protein n=1 Tax=Pelagomonas calceolata TaxID=35677 RepID=A0A8J2SQY7_9STRA|nr:unnamed protein product [Pelagomonas calceolata]
MPRRVAKVAPSGWTYVRSALADLAEEGRRQDLSSSLAQLARTRQLPPLTNAPVHNPLDEESDATPRAQGPGSVARHRAFVKTVEKEHSKRKEAYAKTRENVLKSTPSKSTRRRIERDLDRAEAAAERETLATLAHAHQELHDELAAEETPRTPRHDGEAAHQAAQSALRESHRKEAHQSLELVREAVRQHDEQAPPPLTLDTSSSSDEHTEPPISPYREECKEAPAEDAYEPYRAKLDGTQTPAQYVRERQPAIVVLGAMGAALCLCGGALGASGAWRYGRSNLALFLAPTLLGFAHALVGAVCVVACLRVRRDLEAYFEPRPVAHAHQQLAEETPLRRLIRLDEARRALKEGGTSLEVARAVNEEGKCVEAPADTPGQRLLECCLYVWLFLAILCLGCGAGLIANRRLGETHAANLAERRPGRFAEYFDGEEGAAGRELMNWLLGHGISLLVLAVLGLLPLLPTIKIITVYETVQSGLEWGGAFLSILAMACAVITSLTLRYKDAVDGAAFAAPSDGALWASVIISAIAAFSGTVAWRGGYTENVRLLALFEGMGVFLVPSILIAFALMVAAVARLPPLIERRCDDVVQLLGEDWWDAVLGCRKYASDARRHSSYVRGAGEGWSVTCDDASSNVFAWEYDDEQGSCGCKVDYYGCLNSRPCCNSLKVLIETNWFFLVYGGLVVLILLMGLVKASHYVRTKIVDGWDRKRILHHRNSSVSGSLALSFGVALVVIGLSVLLASTGKRVPPNEARGVLTCDYAPFENATLLDRLPPTDLVDEGNDRVLLEPITEFWPYPTPAPSVSPYPTTSQPSPEPSFLPSPMPSSIPSTARPSTAAPSSSPSSSPPSLKPSPAPSRLPSPRPTAHPSAAPSRAPSLVPTSAPTSMPVPAPTPLPSTSTPSAVPSSRPTPLPTPATPAPSYAPKPLPTSRPTTGAPSYAPSAVPTSLPTPVPAPRPTVNNVMTDGNIRTAVAAWLADAAAAEALYGHISTWGTSAVTDMEALFAHAASFNDDISAWDTSSVTTMYEMFWGASSFNRPIGGWQVDKVTTMEFMFEDASAFDQPIGAWDTSSVTTTHYMFVGASSFNQDLGAWNVSSVVTMYDMFFDAPSFNGDIGAWDVSGVTSMKYMFDDAYAFNRPIGGWDVSNVEDMYGMFEDAFAFNQAIGAWDTSGVTTLEDMFLGARSFNQSLNDWDISSVTDMSWMFQDASAFNKPLDAWNPASVTAMDGMFHNATSFNQPLSEWSFPSVTRMHSMFRYAKAFDQDLGWCVDADMVLAINDQPDDVSSLFYETPCAATSCGVTQDGCTGYAMDDTTIRTAVAAWLADAAAAEATYGHISTWVTSAVTDMEALFAHAASFNDDISAWDTSSVTTMYDMFFGASSFNRDIGKWRVESVTDMRYMFEDAFAFNRPIGNWDVSNVKDMYGMFDWAFAFNQAIGAWDVSGVTRLEEMFEGARSFNQSLNDWDISNVGDMSWMFADAIKFNRPLDAWNLASVTAMDGMFKNATKFNQPLSAWSFPSVTRMHSMFQFAKAFDQYLGWCVDADMVLTIDDDDDGFPDHVSSLFYETPCAATACGVAQEDANGTCPAPTALPTSLPTAQPSSTPTAPSPRPSSHPSVSPSLRPTPAPSVRPTPAPSVTPTPAPTTPQPSSTPTTSAPSNGCVMALHQFLQPLSCEGCARWIDQPADDNCIRELDGVATCQSKAAAIAAVPGWGADTCPTGWTGCSTDVFDVAATSGACKTYENVVVLQSDERAKDCDVVVRASVDGFGSLTFSDNSLATTQLTHVFHGRVVKAGCGGDCWAAGVSDASHGSTASLSFSKEGYSTYTKSVVLGATALPTSSGYYWASSSNSSIGDHCADGTTHAPVSALYCAAHGVDLCAIYAAKYSASSTCQCWAGARIYGGGYGTCSGLPAATGAELRVDAYEGVPCACDQPVSAHVVGAAYLSSATLPPSTSPPSTASPTTPQPSAQPSVRPTPAPSFRADDDERCLVSAGRPNCGDATHTIAGEGLEFISIKPFRATDYHVWIHGNVEAAQAYVYVFDAGGLVSVKAAAPPVCGATTAAEAATQCVYYDDPAFVNAESGKAIWAAPEANRLLGEHTEALCLEGLGLGSVVKPLVVERQRHYTAEAFDTAQLVDSCSPLVSAKPRTSAVWHCSAIIERGVFRCPGRCAATWSSATLVTNVIRPRRWTPP